MSTFRILTRRLAAAVIAPIIVSGLVLAPAMAADAAPVTVHAVAATHYANCAAIHRVYSGGIARAGVTTNTVHSGGRVHHRALRGHVAFSTALYEANSGSDRDHDGIACELS